MLLVEAMVMMIMVTAEGRNKHDTKKKHTQHTNMTLARSCLRLVPCITCVYVCCSQLINSAFSNQRARTQLRRHTLESQPDMEAKERFHWHDRFIAIHIIAMAWHATTTTTSTYPDTIYAFLWHRMLFNLQHICAY